MVGKCCSKLFIYPYSYHLCFFPQDECPSQHHLSSFLSPLVFLLFLSAQTSLSFSVLNNQPTDYKHQETSSALSSPCNAILPRWASGKYPFLPSPLPQGLCTSYFFCQECSSPSLFCFVLFVCFIFNSLSSPANSGLSFYKSWPILLQCPSNPCPHLPSSDSEHLLLSDIFEIIPKAGALPASWTWLQCVK